MQDCVDVAAFLAERGTIDANRTVISGASAGGFTTLRALTAATNPFAGGASWYGITDLATFRAHVPRFQRHHTDHRVGPWPDAAPLYRERSPIRNAAQITQLAFPDEGHGLRRPGSIRHAVEAELTFYGTLLASSQ